MKLIRLGLALTLGSLAIGMVGTTARAEVVGGMVYVDTTWSGEVRVVHTVTVPTEVTLIIEPGCAIYFDQGTELSIQGCLQALGTEDAPITFATTPEAPEGAQAGAVRFSSTWRDSVMEHCVVSGTRSGVGAEDSTISLKHCTVSGTSDTGLVVSRCTVQLQECRFEDNAAYGALLGTASTCAAEACVYERNAGYGFACGDQSKMKLSNCSANENGGEGIRVSSRSSAELANCEARGNGAAGFSVEAADAQLTGCSAEDNGGSGIIIASTAEVLMRETKSTDNGGYALAVHSSSKATAIECSFTNNSSYGLYITSGSEATVRECEITNNSSTGLFLASNSSALCTGNDVLYNGQWGVYIRPDCSANLGDVDNEEAEDDGGNHLQGNASGELCNASPHTIKAHNNFWGSETLAQVLERIHDAGDQEGLGEVEVEPLRAAK